MRASPPPPSAPAEVRSASEPARADSFRAIYAVPADRLAVLPSAAIANVVEEANAWFATQTPDRARPRWMRDAAGSLLVEVVRLPRTAAEYTAGGGALVRSDVYAATAPTPSTVSVVWIEAGAPGTPCGETLGEAPAFVWLPLRACGVRPHAKALWPDAAAYLVAHEVTHAFGAVKPCAPHYVPGFHIGDDRRDILWPGPDRDWTEILLDPGHDDYFLTGSSCGDIATSPLWER